MDIAALQTLQSRIARAEASAKRVESSGYQQSHQMDDGTTHHYSIIGIKSPEQFEDELLAMFIWLWSLKDHLKEAYLAKGLDAKIIESIVNNSFAPQLVSDIANRAKHGTLRNSRSGKFAELTDVGFRIPLSAVAKMTVGAFSVETDISKPNDVELHASIKVIDGVSYNAFAVLEQAQSEWESKSLPILAN